MIINLYENIFKLVMGLRRNSIFRNSNDLKKKKKHIRNRPHVVAIITHIKLVKLFIIPLRPPAA